MMKVAIIGATGYGGVELTRILQNHPKVSIHSVHTSSQQGLALDQSYPHLQGITSHDLEDVDLEKIAKEVDLVFFATPSGVATELVPKVLELGCKVIDLSGDYRLKDPELYKTWYQMEVKDTLGLKQAVYGLSEWIEEDLTEVQLISNPGCFPTAVLLGLAPIMKTDFIDETSIIIDAKTGVSGAGRGLSRASHFSETNENTKIYKVNQHQHTPEIEQMLAKWHDQVAPVTFSTHLVPMTRGILATMYVHVKKPITTHELLELYQESYQDCYFVRIREQGVFPSTKEVYGSNYCDIGLDVDERTNRITIVSVIDNLMKGAAGQAVQNMNKMFGFAEQTGLEFIPIYP